MSTTAFLFPGQGAQAVGMGHELVEHVPQAKQLYQQASEILGYDLAELCFSGPSEKLDATNHSQPALFVTSLAALESLKREAPDVVAAADATAGLSLGEYTALVFAGVFEFGDALRVVQQRGQAMQAAAERVESGMVSVLGLELAVVEQLCDSCREAGEILETANFLCPGNIVVSGHLTACQRIVEAAPEAGAIKAIPLAVAGAFHTPLMESAATELASALASIPMQQPRIPVISNVDAHAHDDPEEIRDLLLQQLARPVRWEESMRQLIADGIEQFYEIGPGRVLRGLLRRTDRSISCKSVSC